MEADITLPPSKVLLRDFAERHELKLTDMVRNDKIAIQSVSVAQILNMYSCSRVLAQAADDPAVALLLNMLDRNFEHAEASIVAFVSGCTASAEVVARAAVESSVNIIYILSGDRPSRLLAYFHHYLDGVDRQVKNWQRQAAGLHPDDASIHQAGIDQRLVANNDLRRFIVEAFEGVRKEPWPKSIEERFLQINEGLSYRTFYARMSSEVHADAEETLRHFCGKIHPAPWVYEQIAAETIYMTRFYIYYAVSLYLRASIKYALVYGVQAVGEKLGKELTAVTHELFELGKHVG